MKVGTIIRPDMGDVIKDSFSLVKFLDEIKHMIDFIEIFCEYPFPLKLHKGLPELRKFLEENRVEAGLHFPTEFQDRWLKKKNFDKLVGALSKFAKDINAKFITIHPGDLTYFLDSTNREEILEGLTKINSKLPCKLVVENGITLLERAEDLDFFAQGGIQISVNICHMYQADLPFEMFSKKFGEWGSRLFMFHVSDYDIVPHLEIRKGKIKWGRIFRRMKNTKAGLCVDAIYSMDNDIVYHNTKSATINSLRLLQKFRR
jgi:sugar phosphate isomerase/epimerase